MLDPADALGRFITARQPSAEAEVCKTFIRGFDSHPRLHSVTA